MCYKRFQAQKLPVLGMGSLRFPMEEEKPGPLSASELAALRRAGA